jgi:hypothetical protein
MTLTSDLQVLTYIYDMTLTSDLQGHLENELAIPNYLGVGAIRFLLELPQSGSVMGEFQFFFI